MKNDDISPIFLFEKEQHKKDFCGSSLHFHDVHELYFLVKGTAKYFIDDQIYVLRAGDMIFIPKGIYHQTNYDNSNEAERILFSFDDNYCLPQLSMYIEQMSAKKHLVFDSHELCKITDTIEKIEKEIIEQNSGHEIMTKLYFEQLLIQISRHQKKAVRSLSPTLITMQKVAKYICDNYDKELTLEILSKQFNISPSYLSTCFKQSAGVGVKEYINITRVQAAKQILKKKNLSIIEVASNCGFNDGNYFAAVFKKIVGITPKKYHLINYQN